MKIQTNSFLPLFGAVFFLTMGQVALACPEGHGRGHGKGPMEELDKNSDKQLSQDEVKGSPLSDKFSEIDADKNGQLTRDELKAHRKANRPTRPADGNEAPAQ